MNGYILIETDEDFELFCNRIDEGVEDPGILKAIFMAGGPGSGKSFVAGELFDIPKHYSFAPSGLRVINSDPAFELNMRKMGIDPKNLGSLSDKDFAKVTDGPDSPRGRAKATTVAQQNAAEIGRLGLLLDATGDDYEKIKKRMIRLQGMGYDTAMLFVNTTLEKAQERNQNRDRVLKRSLVKTIWTDVQKNLGKFKSLFGANFHIIDNTDQDISRTSGNASRKRTDDRGPFNSAFINKLKAAMNKIMKSPLKNQIGIDWIKDQKGGKSLRAEKMRKTESADATDLIRGVMNGVSAEDTLDQLL
jgi:hypothetical protein